MTNTETVKNIRELLKDIPNTTADIDWFNDDTSWSVEVYVSKASSITHAKVLNIMIKNGYTLADYDSNTEIDDTPICYSVVYWFD